MSEDDEDLTREGHLYRGMTEREWRSVEATGFIKSTGRFSFASEGTSFSDDAEDAESYINFGRDDPRKTGVPTYLVEIRKMASIAQARDGYWKTKTPIPKSAITRAWKMVGDDDGEIIGSLISNVGRSRMIFTPE